MDRLVWLLPWICVLAMGPAGDGEAPPSDAPAAEPGEPTSTADDIEAVIVRAPAARADALGQALQVRLAPVPVLPFTEDSYAQAESRRFAYASVEPDPDTGGTRIELVLFDGRAYRRAVPRDEEHDDRAVALTIANLLAAIEEERLLPDRTQVQVPRPEPEPPPEPEPEPPPEPVPPPEPPPEPVPPPERPPGPPPITFELGGSLRGLANFGLSPRPIPGPTSVGGTAAFAIRWPIAIYVEGGARLTTAASRGLRLLRTRVHASAGYAYRRGWLAAGVGAGPTIEAWGVRADGSRADTTGPDGGRRPPLIGVLAQGHVGVVFPRSDADADVRARIAAHLQLSASALPSGAAARVVESPGGPAVFVAGGVEATTGVDATVWFGVRRRRRTAAPAPTSR